MGWRFRKSIKILPGVKINIGKNGVSSFTLGGKRASVNVGKKGVYSNFSIPGTGLSNRTKLGGNSDIQDVSYSDFSIPSSGDTQKHIRTVDDQLSRAFTRFHLYTPAPGDTSCAAIALQLNGYERVKANKPRFFSKRSKIDPKKKEDVDSKLRDLCVGVLIIIVFYKLGFLISFFLLGVGSFLYNLLGYLKEKKEWKKNMAYFEARKQEYESLLAWHDEYPAEAINATFSSMKWGGILNASVSVSERGEDGQMTAYVDLDTFSAEEWPGNDDRGARDSAGYARFVHSAAFLCTGLAFWSSHFFNRAVVSVYAPCVDPVTGNFSRKCLLSASVSREQWKRINFNNLEAVDPIATFAAVPDVRVNITKAGIFTAVEPIA